MDKMLLLFSLCFLLIKVSNSESNLSKQIPFQFYNQTYSYPSIRFYGMSGDLVNITIQSDRQIKQWYIILTTRLSPMTDFSQIKDTISHKLAPQNSTSYSHQLNLFQDRQYLAILKIVHKNFDIFYTRITVALNGQLIKQHYQIVQNFSFKPNCGHVYHIKTTKKCKAKMRFKSNGCLPTGLFLYSPNNKNNYTIFHGGSQYYNLTFDTEGIWKLVFFFREAVQENIICSYTTNFTTFEDDKCINECTDLNDSKVVAMAYLGQGKQVCICNQNITGIFWDQNTRKCIQSHSKKIPESSCNQNGIKEEGQQCDSNHQEGCDGCHIVIGYSCTQYLDLSICRKKTISIEKIVFIAFGAVALVVCTFVSIYCIKKKQKMDQKLSEFKNYRNFRIKKAIKEGKMKEKNPELLNPSIPCGICLKSDCTIALAGCFHYFHGQCILEWLRTDKECPVCKKSYLQGLSSVENIKEQL